MVRGFSFAIAVLCTCSSPLEAHTTSASLASFSSSRRDARGVDGLLTCASARSLGTEKRGEIGRGWADAERAGSEGESVMRLRGGGLLAASITCVPPPAPSPPLFIISQCDIRGPRSTPRLPLDPEPIRAMPTHRAWPAFCAAAWAPLAKP